MDTYRMSAESDLVIVKPEGAIISRSYPEFEKKLKDALGPDTKLLFDMENVEIVNNVGIVFLLRIAEISNSINGYFTMYNLPANVERVVRRLQLQSVLNVVNSIEGVFFDICKGYELDCEIHAANAA